MFLFYKKKKIILKRIDIFTMIYFNPPFYNHQIPEINDKTSIEKAKEFIKLLFSLIQEHLKAIAITLSVILLIVTIVLSAVLISTSKKQSKPDDFPIKMTLLSKSAEKFSGISIKGITPTSVLSCGKPNTRSKTSRIINGKNVLNNKWPWVVSIHKKNMFNDVIGHFCGGTLITKRYVLSAAHCMKSLRAEKVFVVANNEILNVEKIFVHDLYKFTTFSENDIALIKLKEDVRLSTNVSLICLPERQDEADEILNKTVVVAGFGENLPNNLLQDTELEIINGDSLCDSSGFYNSTILYCALDKHTRDSNLCTGDSGSPLFSKIKSNWFLFGIASYVTADNKTGSFECMPTLPSYFTKVAMYLDWITMKIEEN
jgi:V8-like Glu-specific endopeptidase